MRKLLIFLFLVLSSVVSATNYYISATGSDGAAGTSPETAWKTITKVNTSFAGLKPGDAILFKRGDTFYGTLVISSSGSKGSPIIVGAYSSGADPVLSGFTTITGWSDQGNGIFSQKVSCQSSTNMVTVNGINTEKGRWPNTGFRTFEAHNNDISITDIELPGTPNWTGAEVVIRKSPWLLDLCTITNHTTNTLTYTTGYPSTPIDGYGYFIQNDLKTLDALGEWYYDGTDIYMYFGAEDPSDYVVKVSTLDYLVSIPTGMDYITLDNLNIQGGNFNTILLNKADHVTIQNCDIDFSGFIGIQATSSLYTIINNNTINHSNSRGVYLFDWVVKNYATVSNNIISNTGLFGGMLGSTGEDDAGDGIVCNVYNATIEYNVITNSGHSGIRFGYDSTLVQYNLIDSFAIVRNDAGGIYAYAGTLVDHNSVIADNIILNGIGASGGQLVDAGWNNWIICGIYLDVHHTENFKITGNTVANIRDFGIFLQSVNNIIADNNTVYNCGTSQLYLNEKADRQSNRNLTITNNKFIAKEIDDGVHPQVTLWIRTQIDDGNQFGTADNNYYARPLDDNDVIKRNYGSLWPYIDYTLAQWKAYSGKDANSHKSPISIPNDGKANIDNYIQFLYNPFKSNVDYDAKGNYIDVTGKKYFKFSLKPYTSVILFNTTDTKEKILGPIYSIFVYPNPANNMLNVLVPGVKDKETILIIDITGKIILEENIEFEKSLVNVSSLPKGMYMVLLRGIKSTGPCKFIKN